MSDEITIPKEDYEKMTKTVERLGKILPTLEVLCGILVPRKTINDRLGLNKNTLSQNSKIDKLSELGRREVLIRIEDISVIKKRKKR